MIVGSISSHLLINLDSRSDSVKQGTTCLSDCLIGLSVFDLSKTKTQCCFEVASYKAIDVTSLGALFI